MLRSAAKQATPNKLIKFDPPTTHNKRAENEAISEIPPGSVHRALTLCSPLWVGARAGPTAVGGSAANTTTAFDGTYRGLIEPGDSGVGAGLKPRDPYTAGCQRFDAPPPMTVTNGLAQFQALGVTFAGYMTPQGDLRMVSGHGPTVNASFDAQTSTLRGQANSINCRYDVVWQKGA